MSYYARSPFLFWTMACTGARRFHDVKYFQQAASKVRELVTASILQIQDPIPTIQAILILCLWPLPVDTMWKDPSHTMAGAAMQLAIQNGLHKFGHEQDFRKPEINGGDRNTRIFRVHLWLSCVVHFQRSVISHTLIFSVLTFVERAFVMASLFRQF
jgi:transcriptional regulatory protein LEU3